MRHSRGSSSVELILIMPIVVVLLAGIGYLHSAGMTGLAALHAAETQTWRTAMSNSFGVCGSSKWSFLGGGVRTSTTRQVPRPAPPLPPEWSVPDTRSNFMPCAEAVGDPDGQ